MPSAGRSMSSCARKASLQPPPVRSELPMLLPEHTAPPRSAFSQRLLSPARQRAHSGSPLWAHRSVGSTMTRWPSRAHRVRAACSTTPTISCPGTSTAGCSYPVSTDAPGVRWSIAKSVLQMPDSAGRTSTQPGRWGSGVATSRKTSGSAVGDAPAPFCRRDRGGRQSVGSTTSALMRGSAAPPVLLWPRS
jgi:hypothetical protein